MDVVAAGILGCIGLVLALISYDLDIRGKDGGGWAFIALCMFIGACEKL